MFLVFPDWDSMWLPQLRGEEGYEDTYPPPRIAQNWNSKINSLSVIFLNSTPRVVKRSENQFFLFIIMVYIFMGLVLQVALSFRVVTKSQKSLKQICIYLLLPLGMKGLKQIQTDTLIKNIFALATMIKIHFVIVQWFWLTS